MNDKVRMGYTTTCTPEDITSDSSSSQSNSSGEHFSIDTDIPVSLSSPTSVTTAMMHTSYQYPMEQHRNVSIVENDEEDGVVDLYGQTHPNETKEMIQNALRDFDDAVQNRLPNKKKSSLINAQRKCPELMTDSFKLMFLRCECFKVDLAVKRYASYWDKRVEAFGPIHAFQPLTLNGPLKDDIIPLELGSMTVIRRKNDRDILFFDPSKLDKTKYTRESALRAFWYFFHALLEDTEVQKRGIIILNYNANYRNSNRDPPFTKMCFNTIKGALPLRMSAIHGTHVPYFYGCVITLVMIFLGERLRKRIIVHNGTNDEVNKALGLFGISVDDIPTDMGGLLKLDVQEWLEERRIAGL